MEGGKNFCAVLHSSPEFRDAATGEDCFPLPVEFCRHFTGIYRTPCKLRAGFYGHRADPVSVGHGSPEYGDAVTGTGTFLYG